MNEKAIGIFDSGVGGLTIVQEILRLLPDERLIYFGDTGRLPYGNKSRSTIERYSLENAEFLLKKDIKALIIACNTSSALALPYLKDKIALPMIDVIYPAALQGISETKNKKIGILGTKGTIHSGAYQTIIHSRCPEAVFFPVACPLLVHLVEEQWIDHPVVSMIVHEYLHSFKEHNIDTLILGCTHYPFLKDSIQKEVGDHVKLINPARATAFHLALYLKQNNLFSDKRREDHEFYVSDDPKKFHALACDLFGNQLVMKEPILHSFENDFVYS